MAKAVQRAEMPTSGANKGIGGKKSGRSAKDSGTYFERMTEDFFSQDGVSAKRIIGSGALGKIMKDPTLLGDVRISYPILAKDILADCKFGYGGLTQLTLKKLWFDKIEEEAKLTNKFPAMIGKFKGARGKNSRFIAFSWETWKELMESLSDLVENYEGIINGIR